MIKRKHLIGEIRDNQAGPPGAIIISSVNAHAGARNTVLAERNPGRYTLLFKRPVVFVQIEFIRLRVVGQKNVGPSVIVVIENRDPQALGRVVEEMGFLCRLFKLAVAEVVPEAR